MVSCSVTVNTHTSGILVKVIQLCVCVRACVCVRHGHSDPPGCVPLSRRCCDARQPLNAAGVLPVNVTRSRSEATFPGGAAEEQEPSGSVCPSVCLPASRRSLSGTRTHTDTHTQKTPPVSGFTVTGGHGSSAVLLPCSPLRDVPPSDAPVPVEEQREEEEGASPSFFDHQADSPPERLNTGGGEEEEEAEEEEEEKEVGESEGL